MRNFGNPWNGRHKTKQPALKRAGCWLRTGVRKLLGAGGQRLLDGLHLIPEPLGVEQVERLLGLAAGDGRQTLVLFCQGLFDFDFFENARSHDLTGDVTGTRNRERTAAEILRKSGAGASTGPQSVAVEPPPRKRTVPVPGARRHQSLRFLRKRHSRKELSERSFKAGSVRGFDLPYAQRPHTNWQRTVFGVVRPENQPPFVEVFQLDAIGKGAPIRL